jgi:hypothetical protein
MRMAVMDIRPVPVDMRYGLMGMDMVVRFLASHPFVGMLMVLIVEMPVVMSDRFMGVLMPVFFPVQNAYPAEHQCRG